MAGVRLRAAQADALREHLISRLTGISDLWLAVSREEFDIADRLAGEYSDELRLLHDDLGWQQRAGDLELTTPPDVLRRTFRRLRETAAVQRISEEAEWHEFQRFIERNALLGEACDVVLGGLGGDAPRRGRLLSRVAGAVRHRRQGRGPP